MMRITAAMFVALEVLVVPLGLAATASATTTGTNRNVTPSDIGPVPTDRFGGGMKVGNVTTIDLNVTATDLRYSWVSPLYNSSAEVGDGMLNTVAFDFHLAVTVEDKSLTLPWYKVTVSGLSREITDVSFEGNRTISGPSVVMGAKYDHVIEGWDFADPGNRLALETHLIFGNYYPDRTVDFIHAAYYRDTASSGNDTWREDANTVTNFTAPQIYTRDQIVFDDQWTRIGRFAWASNVTVDGVQERMRFQVQGGTRLLVSRGGAIFQGFAVRAAFLYPAGQSIIHDPTMSAESFMPTIASGFNLTPFGILLVQVAVVGVAIIPALYLRTRARRTPT